MIIFLTVICLVVSGFFYYRFNQVEKKLTEYQTKVAKDFDIISKYLLKIVTQDDMFAHKVDIQGMIEKRMSQNEKFLGEEFSETALRHEVTQLKIDEAKKELIQVFEKERIEIEQSRGARTKDTFKSLKAAFASTGKEQDDG